MLKLKYKSIRISEERYKDIRNIQHDKRFNTLKEVIDYLVELYKGE